MTHHDQTPSSVDDGDHVVRQAPHISFWQDRCIELGMVLALALYYVVGNPTLHLSFGSLAFSQLNPLFSLPFLGIFVLLAFWRLPIAVALLPLTFPYYYLPKVVYQRGTSVDGGLRFSMVEIVLWTCIVVALLHLLFTFMRRRPWSYRLSWKTLLDRAGPFLIPMLLFGVMALISVFIAYERSNALRTLRQEVIGPFAYVLLLFFCLRSRTDIKRLVTAFFVSGLIIALIGTIQYFVLSHTLKHDAVPGRIAAVYGSGNNVGLFFDYTLPVGMALILSRVHWRWRFLALLACVPFVFVLLLSDSRGSWLLAMPIVALFVIACAIRQRKVLLWGGVALALLAVLGAVVFYQPVSHYIVQGHSNERNQSTVQKRIYLWQSAMAMISDSPWLGYGLDNWLCHYSNSFNNVCLYPHGRPSNISWQDQKVPRHPKLKPYLIEKDPVTGASTGLTDEPDLSHPHNIFLHVWVSIGLFGLLAFVTVLLLSGWLFVALLRYIDRLRSPSREQWRWLLVGTGAALLAALVQGQVDSAFLEQDLAFCFWTLIAALLVIRALVGMPWRAMISRIEPV